MFSTSLQHVATQFQNFRYLDRKREARGGDLTLHRRDLMPQCVVDRCRHWYPNLESVPYMGHMWE